VRGRSAGEAGWDQTSLIARVPPNRLSWFFPEWIERGLLRMHGAGTRKVPEEPSVRSEGNHDVSPSEALPCQRFPF
jgi:hypothetical protein